MVIKYNINKLEIGLIGLAVGLVLHQVCKMRHKETWWLLLLEMT